jgi:hypothetical protein
MTATWKLRSITIVLMAALLAMTSGAAFAKDDDKETKNQEVPCCD